MNRNEQIASLEALSTSTLIKLAKHLESKLDNPGYVDPFDRVGRLERKKDHESWLDTLDLVYRIIADREEEEEPVTGHPLEGLDPSR